jgi:hypothetical protein
VSNVIGVQFIFDTDALAQIFLTEHYNIFQILSSDFGVDSYLMSEVEVELRSNKKFGALIRPRLDKALRTKALKLITSAELERMQSEGSDLVSLGDIRELARDYALDVGTGEAATHAAGVLLDVPTVSNDFNAIRVLEEKGRILPPTILRSFDLFGFLFFEKYIDASAGEQIRKTLRAQNEGMPATLINQSFEDGIQGIQCRLSTSLSLVASGGGWRQALYLQRKTESNPIDLAEKKQYEEE